MTQQLTPAAAILRIVCETVIEANDVGGVDLNDLVDRLAAAGHDLPTEDQPTAAEQQRHTASTITDDALDQLYARIATLEHVAAGNKRHVQLIVPELQQAQAAICRVRQMADAWEQRLPETIRTATVVEAIRTALDASPSCAQHPNAPSFAGLCGGCTQYPTDMTPEIR